MLFCCLAQELKKNIYWNHFRELHFLGLIIFSSNFHGGQTRPVADNFDRKFNRGRGVAHYIFIVIFKSAPNLFDALTISDVSGWQIQIGLPHVSFFPLLFQVRKYFSMGELPAMKCYKMQWQVQMRNVWPWIQWGRNLIGIALLCFMLNSISHCVSMCCTSMGIWVWQIGFEDKPNRGDYQQSKSALQSTHSK